MSEQEPTGRELDIALAKALGYDVVRIDYSGQAGTRYFLWSESDAGRIGPDCLTEESAWGDFSLSIHELIYMLRRRGDWWDAFVEETSRRYPTSIQLLHAADPQVICQAALAAIKKVNGPLPNS